MILRLLAVGCGGFLGAISRYLVGTLLQERTQSAFPLGTLCVNVLGCFAIGALWGAFEDREVSENTRLFLSTGLLGGLTTFSTFGLETVTLWREGQLPLALASVLANLVLGVGAVLAGRALVRLFL